MSKLGLGILVVAVMVGNVLIAGPKFENAIKKHTEGEENYQGRLQALAALLILENITPETKILWGNMPEISANATNEVTGKANTMHNWLEGLKDYFNTFLTAKYSYLTDVIAEIKSEIQKTGVLSYQFNATEEWGGRKVPVGTVEDQVEVTGKIEQAFDKYYQQVLSKLTPDKKKFFPTTLVMKT